MMFALGLADDYIHGLYGDGMAGFWAGKSGEAGIQSTGTAGCPGWGVGPM